ncbi:T-complex protein 1 subunit delta-like [Zingiber officinale]|uniref:T-complex protein 1 subunit delta-like n=1 Tax=Zingiber officinale TaxID=94328 RepID=UPI001C4D0FAE|nr:T-complex protein 1 subunit delta-like [Zingiber officinale]
MAEYIDAGGSANYRRGRRVTLHYLVKAKILVVKDAERDEIEFITKTLNCLPIANIEHFREDKLRFASSMEESSVGNGKIVKFTEIEDMGRTTTVLVRGQFIPVSPAILVTNTLVAEDNGIFLSDHSHFKEADLFANTKMVILIVSLDQAEIKPLIKMFTFSYRCLVNKKFLIAGGGAPKCPGSSEPGQNSKELQGMESYRTKEFAEALEVIPYTLAENASLNSIAIVTMLGINVRKGQITNILEENIVQPLLVRTSTITLAAE